MERRSAAESPAPRCGGGILDAAHPAEVRDRLRKAAPAAELVVHDPRAALPPEQPADADVVVATGDYRYEALADAAARAGPAMPF